MRVIFRWYMKNEKLVKMIEVYRNLNYTIIETKNKKPEILKWTSLTDKPNLYFKDCNIATINEAGFIIPEDIIVIDVDIKNFPENIDSLEELNKAINFDLLNETSFSVKTASGGFHLYFKKNPAIKFPNEVDKFKGVEFKQKGQQVIIPYSILPNGRQYLLHVEQRNLDKLIELPNSFYQLFEKNTKNDRTNINYDISNHETDIEFFKEYLAQHEEIGCGDRNNTLFKFACEARDMGLTIEKAKEIITEADKINPPLDSKEFNNTVASAYKDLESFGCKSIAIMFGNDFFLQNDMLPEVLMDFVNDNAERLQCPKDIIAASSVVMLSSLLASKCIVQTAQNDKKQSIVPNLWGMAILPPSSRKTAALKVGSDLLKPLIAKATNTFQSEMMFYKEQLHQYNASIKKPQKTTNNTNQSEIIKEPIKPTEKRYVINDATVEKVGIILAEDIGCKTVVCDELIGFINNLEKDKGISDKAFYLQSWNGNDSYKVERISRDSIHIPNLCLSIIGNMTPQNIDAYFSKYFDGFKNDGFIQRFQLMVFPDLSNKQHKHIDRQENQELANKMMLIVESIDKLNFIDCDKIDTFDGKYYFKFTPDTQEFYIKWYLNLLNKENKQEETEILIEHFTKYTKLVPALALIFDIIISATNNQKQGLISIDAMKMAIRYSDYLKLHARKVYSRRKIRDKDIIGFAMQLLTKIKNDNRYQNGFFIRDIERNEWSGLTNKQILKSTIAYLEKEEYIVAEKTEKSVLYKLGFEKMKQNDKSTDSTDS